MRSVLNSLESLDERLDVVALLHILVLEAHRLEYVQLSLAVCLAQQFKVAVQSAVVLGYGHLVVVHHYYYIGAQLGSHVQAFESLASAQRTVADDSYHVLLASENVACLLQTCSQSNRRRCMTYLEAVILRRFGRTAVARYLGHARAVDESVSTSRKHLVRIYLVRHIEHNLVFRHIEYIVQCNRSLNKSEIRAHVSAYHTVTFEYASAYLGGKKSQFFCRQVLDVCR